MWCLIKQRPDHEYNFVYAHHCVVSICGQYFNSSFARCDYIHHFKRLHRLGDARPLCYCVVRCAKALLAVDAVQFCCYLRSGSIVLPACILVLLTNRSFGTRCIWCFDGTQYYLHHNFRFPGVICASLQKSNF